MFEELYLNRDDYIFVVDEKGGIVYICIYFIYLLLNFIFNNLYMDLNIWLFYKKE